MSWKLSFGNRARENIGEISEFITETSGSEDVAESFVFQLLERCGHLASLPGSLGTSRPELAEGIRSTPHKGYIIFFRYAGGVLEVVNVLHASRDLIAYFSDDP